MNASHFYVYLSNQDKYSKFLFPSNSTLDFTTKLSQSLKLEGNWEVGVKSITLDQSWSTFESDVVSLWVTKNSKLLTEFNNKAAIRPKYYNSIIEILNELNKICTKYFEFVKEKITKYEDVVLNNDKSVSFAPKFDLKTLSGEVKADCGKVIYTINKTSTIELLLCLRIPKNLFKILFSSTTFKDINKLNALIGPHSQNFNHFNLILQSDIVSFSLYGASDKQILRVFQQDFENQEKIYSKSFDRIEYIPLIRKEINSIQISLSKVNGFLTEIKSGLLQLTLHFKKCE
jgi:regulator of sigma D